jgi:hypothetical protein
VIGVATCGDDVPYRMMRVENALLWLPSLTRWFWAAVGRVFLIIIILIIIILAALAQAIFWPFTEGEFTPTLRGIGSSLGGLWPFRVALRTGI